MHSRIFQITTTKVERENYLNEDTLELTDSSCYDSCSEIGSDERQVDIDILVNHVLPKGMFEFVDDNTLRFLGVTEEWNREFFASVIKKVEEITSDNVWDCFGPVYELGRILRNPLNTDYLFYMDKEGTQRYAEESYKFMQYVCTLKPGTLLHIGGVIDYHC